ncbi:hypothetical protein ES703_102097 [subsurface metagenome]
MFATMKLIGALNGKKIRSDTGDLCSHIIKHLAQLLDIRLTCSMIDRSDTFGHNSRHYKISSSCYRGFLQQHIGSTKFFGRDGIIVIFLVVNKFGSQINKTVEMNIKSAATYFISSGFGYVSFSKTG